MTSLQYTSLCFAPKFEVFSIAGKANTIIFKYKPTFFNRIGEPALQRICSMEQDSIGNQTPA